MEIKAENLMKVFNRRIIFEKVNFHLKNGDGLGIIGKNGSGKSTMVKIIAGLISPTQGKISYFEKEKQLENDTIFKEIGFVAPYLNLYDEFTAIENLMIFDKIRGSKNGQEQYKDIFEDVDLYEKKNEYVQTFSSGMKQRLKYAFALVNRPSILILDEPNSNLDADGIKMTREMMEIQRMFGGILIIATNDAPDLKSCNSIIDLNKFNHVQ